MSHRESIEKEIKKYASDYITREASKLSLITITRCEISEDDKRAVVFVSVLPDKAAVIAQEFLKRHQDEIRQYVMKHSKIHRMPWLRFTLDMGEKNRQVVSELLANEK